MGKVAYRSFDIGDEDGVNHHYEAGDEVPDEVAELVTNPTVWGPDDWDPQVSGGSEPLPEEEDDWSAEDQGEYDDDYEDHTVAQLTEIARERNVELQSTKKADIIAALRAADGGGVVEE